MAAPYEKVRENLNLPLRIMADGLSVKASRNTYIYVMDDLKELSSRQIRSV